MFRGRDAGADRAWGCADRAGPGRGPGGSRNTDTGTDELHPVIATYVRDSHTLVDLTIDQDVVTTTPDHPFMVQDRGWVTAGDLQPGDTLVTPTGTTTLTGIQERESTDTTTVYNFQVASTHTYYALAGTTPILVHNANYNPNAGAANSEANFVYRGLAEGEDPALGLVARNPEAGNSVASHVGGARDTQWISTTKDEALAAGKYGQHGYVRIDLNKVGSEVVDVSGGIPGMPSNYMLPRWARNAQEVLIRGNIPPGAIG
ncbi:MAG: polymorphic toxin-type HINT domain-containing protein [Actinomycetales bacterium]